VEGRDKRSGLSARARTNDHPWRSQASKSATPIVVDTDRSLQGNILIDNSGTPRICDFGLARIFLEVGRTEMTTTSEHTGTARYLAPELAADEAAYPTTASDVYALGCLGLEVSPNFAGPAHILDNQLFHSLYIFKGHIPTA
jgi:Protein kinase domain